MHFEFACLYTAPSFDQSRVSPWESCSAVAFGWFQFCSLNRSLHALSVLTACIIVDQCSLNVLSVLTAYIVSAHCMHCHCSLHALPLLTACTVTAHCLHCHCPLNIIVFANTLRNLEFFRLIDLFKLYQVSNMMT